MAAYSALLGVADDPPHVLAGVAGDLDDVDLPHTRDVGFDDLFGEVEAALFDDGLSPLVGGRRSVQGCRHTVIVTDRLLAIQGWPTRVALRGDVK